MQQFEDIRPYRDDEVPAILDRLITDPELIDTLLTINSPRLGRWFAWIMRPLVQHQLRQKLAGIRDVRGLQDLIGVHLRRLLTRVSSGFSVSGVERLDGNQSYLFLCNHRDIAMDPGMVNLALYERGMETARIAIGDNLLTKPFTSDLMRLNKSFIVKRSVTGRRDKLEALKNLSAYIRHSILNERSSVWLAQREGRAKNGIDRTETAMIKMLALSRGEGQSFGEALAALNIVPVAISYEFDPCDGDKARELYARETLGSYQKAEHEDIDSIFKGIMGAKGAIHVAFGELLDAEFEDAQQVADAVDRQIIRNYRLQATNFIAYAALGGDDPRVREWRAAIAEEKLAEARAAFSARLTHLPTEHRKILLTMYANPVLRRLELCG